LLKPTRSCVSGVSASVAPRAGFRRHRTKTGRALGSGRRSLWGSVGRRAGARTSGNSAGVVWGPSALGTRRSYSVRLLLQQLVERGLWVRDDQPFVLRASRPKCKQMHSTAGRVRRSVSRSSPGPARTNKPREPKLYQVTGFVRGIKLSDDDCDRPSRSTRSRAICAAVSSSGGGCSNVKRRARGRSCPNCSTGTLRGRRIETRDSIATTAARNSTGWYRESSHLRKRRCTHLRRSPRIGHPHPPTRLVRCRLASSCGGAGLQP
jgi:hypothetical protein